VAYRDEHERCPRCGTDLVDAVVGYACTACQGIWISPASVQEMAIQMQTPPALIDLPFEEVGRAETLACPTCRESMQTRELFEVAIDVCAKHGIWFDARELALVLLRSARKPA
jgi:Zn-finger nucleic acid-binding protein